jgi:type IV secretion system protein VirD4
MFAKLQAIRRLDGFGLLLLLIAAALAVAAGYAALHFGWFSSPWHLAIWLLVCAAFLVVGLPSQTAPQATIALSKWADRAAIERAGIDQKTSPKATKTEAGRIEAGNEGIYLGFFADTIGAIVLRYKEGKHLLSFGTPGANKSTGLVVPNLQHLRRSVIVIDPKGELAAITAGKREKMGRVIVLNPFKLFAKELPHLKSAGWNPLLQLDPDSDDFAGDAYCIADALVETPAKGDDYWSLSARNLAIALVMWERYSAGDKANLSRLRALVTAPNKFNKDGGVTGGFLFTLYQMAGCKHAAISNVSERFRKRSADAKEGKSQSNSLEDVIETFMAATRFLDDPRIGVDMAAGGAIDFGALHRDVTTIYLILPADELIAQAKWLRLFVNLALRKLYKNPPTNPTLPPVLLMLDEFGNLGWLSQIENALTVSRGYRIQLWMFLQNLAQLKGNYKDKWETFFTGAGAVTSFKTGDMETAEQLAKFYGNAEKSVPTQTATGVSNTPHAIPLIRPEDINRLARGKTISIIEPCDMPIEGSAPVYPATDYAEGLDANPYFHG